VLNSTKSLIEKGEQVGKTCTTPVSKSGSDLVNKVYALEPTGATALGPALAVAIGIASKAAGSKIMICTDGKANCGVGQSDNPGQYYTETAQVAKSRGVSVSVITMEGEDCSMENLGTVADITSGQVEIVNPLQLSTKVVSLMNRQVLATAVVCKVLLSRHLRFRNEDKPDVISKVMRELGNVNEETDLSFAFEWSDEAKKQFGAYETANSDEKKENKFVNELLASKVPFQLQVQYSTMDSRKFTKVVTSMRPISFERMQVEKDIVSLVPALQAVHESARIAQIGKYNDARVNLVSVLRLLQRTMFSAQHQKDYLSYVVQAEKLDQFMREAQSQEAVFGAVNDVARQKTRDDASSKAMFQMKSVSGRTFRERK